VVLAHNADAVKDLVKWDGIDLILSGHTHGGLSCFPTIAEAIVEWIRTNIPDNVLYSVSRHHTIAFPAVNSFCNTHACS
jgi:predicted MPP superfamily phosphohydrolase